MKNQREIYEALLAGETLIASSGNKYKMVDDKTMVRGCGEWIDSLTTFNCPAKIEIYTKPKWYENIPDGGVICWAGQADVFPLDKPAIITKYETNSPYKYNFVSLNSRHYKAIPLTKQEMQVFMDNAPEE